MMQAPAVAALWSLIGSLMISGIPAPTGNDLDALMREVLERRAANHAALGAFEFNETETMEIRGQEGVAPVQSYSKVFAWRLCDGRLVRDPISVNGVPLDGPGLAWGLTADDSDSGLSIDDFYDWDSFFNFRFEPGRYLLAGRETFAGREVLRIEYYPSHLLSRVGDDAGIRIDFDRTTSVIMLVLAEERQIVAWALENVGMQFLPFRWLVRAGALDVWMTFDTAPDGTWLPRRFHLSARATVATSQLTIEMNRTFHDFVGATDGMPVSVRSIAVGDSAFTSNGVPDLIGADPAGRHAATVVRVEFHGNFSLPDEQLGEVAGVSPGDPLTADLAAEVRRRLLDSGLVDRVDVRVRGTSLQDSDEVALVIVVRQRVGIGDHFLMLPMFEWSDEYGITVGARISVVELYGIDESLSFPLTIGGRDRAAVEFIDDFQDRFLSGVRASAGYLGEVNPHFNELETRVSVEARVLRRFGRFQLDVEAGWADVEFLGAEDEQVSFGVAAFYDTRRQTGLPRNAVYVGGGWRPLQIIDGEYLNRFSLDGRGYLGVFGGSTFVIGARFDGADGELPAYERYLLGGMATLRGFAPGEFIGDNRAIASAEIRMSVWEPFPVVLIGVNAFWDTGSVWNHGTDVTKAKFYNGVGGGVFLMAAFLQLNVDVAYGLDNGWQVHIGSGLRY